MWDYRTWIEFDSTSPPPSNLNYNYDPVPYVCVLTNVTVRCLRGVSATACRSSLCVVPSEAVTSVSFSRDGHCLLVSSLDGRLRLLDKDNGEMLNE